MWTNYKFKTDGKLLFHLEIHSSFSPSAYFEIDENTNANYTAYWRVELPRSEYYDNVISKMNFRLRDTISITELSNIDEYGQLLNRYCPVRTENLSASQKIIVDNLLKDELDTDVEMPSGRDGHSFFIKTYRPSIKEYRCWCKLPNKWKALSDLIDVLVNDISGLEDMKYGVYVEQ